MKRREFLTRAGCAAVGSFLQPLWWPIAARAMTGKTAGNGKILVVVVFQGGNDGLNTVVPVTDGLYYAYRPTIAIPANQTISLEAGTGFHPSLAPIMPLWNSGKVAVVREVGYPDMNLSHFRGTDIIFSGSDDASVISTGWLGRWLEGEYPDFPSLLPEDPMALQQGFSAQLPLQGDRGVAGVVVQNPGTFAYLVNSTYAGGYSDALPNTPAGDELAFLRSIDAASFQYAAEIETAANAGSNTVAYPGSRFADQLATVARLIDGDLGTPVYLTALGGFDTHADQPGAHPELLSDFASAVTAFMADLQNLGRGDDVILLTVSEFGRRVEENGSDGSDHGTAAPWFAIGNQVTGGLYGSPPDLEGIDNYGNLPVSTDYRSVYATILNAWFHASPSKTNEILLGSFPYLGLFSGGLASPSPDAPSRVRLHAPRQNPVRGALQVSFDLPEPAPVSLSVFDVRGRRVSVLREGFLPAGAHEATWDGRAPAGVYFVRLEAAGERQTQKVTVR